MTKKKLCIYVKKCKYVEDDCYSSVYCGVRTTFRKGDTNESADIQATKRKKTKIKY